MNEDSTHIAKAADADGQKPPRRRSGLRRFLKIVAITLGCLTGLVVAGVAAFFIWASPERLSRLVDAKASEYLEADVSTAPIHFTVVSTFPWLCVEVDSVRLDSRKLRDLPESVRRSLPADCDFLASTGRLTGGINLMTLLRGGKISLRGVSVDRLRLNLVAVNDTLDNYAIVPPEDGDSFRIPEMDADSVILTRPAPVKYFNLASGADFTARIDGVTLSSDPSGEDTYRLATSGDVTAIMRGTTMAEDFPFALDGLVSLGFKPLRAGMKGYGLSLGNMEGTVDLDMTLGTETLINSLTYEVAPFNPMAMTDYIPEIAEALPMLKEIRSDILLSARASLRRPYRLLTSTLPAIDVEFDIPSGSAEYSPAKGRGYSVSRVGGAGRIYYDGENPDASYADLERLSVRGEGIAADLSGRLADIFRSPRLAAKLRLDASLDSVASLVPQLRGYALRGRLKGSTDFKVMLASLKSGKLDSLNGDGHITVSDFSMRPGKKGGTKAKVKHMALDLSVKKKASAAKRMKGGGPHMYDVRRQKDAESLARLAHTPEYLVMKPVAGLKEWLDAYDAALDLSLKGGLINTPAYPSDTKIARFAGRLTADTLRIRDVAVSNRSSRMSGSGYVANLRELLTSGRAVEIPVRLDVRLDTVNINQLAGTYERGLMLTKGTIASMTAPKPATLTASDRMALLIPRNIRADIRATAKETVYMNLHLYDLATRVRVAGGDAVVDTLSIGSDFGHAVMKLKYRSSDMQRMGVDASLGVLDINVVNFFRNFHTLLVMMPQMKNLHGMLSGRMSGTVDIFPTMYVNVPSLTARIGVNGWDLLVHQDDFIRRVTRMMMIPSDGDIHIEDMNVHAYIHDNLLELYPFHFNFNRYSLLMGGVNNFNGNLYYHVGVEKSPLHFPFGINIEGEFHHPKLRFGGAHYSPDRAAEITADVMMENDINVTRELKYFLRQFVHHAALADTVPPTRQ